MNSPAKRPAGVIALSGGVGGAKLAAGLARVLPPEHLLIVGNTGDDFEHLGLHISPDLDSILYGLSERNDTQRGWGRSEETWNFMRALGEVCDDTWFKLGDQDLALHVYRTWQLRQGHSLSGVTDRIASRFGIAARVAPMSDDPVRTLVHTPEGELEFQEYFVREGTQPRVLGFTYAGAASARIPASITKWIAEHAVTAVIICPSNPFVSIAPILAIPAWRDFLEGCGVPIVAVSPIVGGRALKGPAAKMLAELGYDVSPVSLLEIQGLRMDGLVIDAADALLAPAIESRGVRSLVCETIMRTSADQTSLAARIVEFAQRLDSRANHQ